MKFGRIEMITQLSAIMNHSVRTSPRPMFHLLIHSFTLPTKFILMFHKNIFKFVTLSIQ